MPRRSWLDQQRFGPCPKSGKQVRARRFVLACMWSGILQKPGAHFAKDVVASSKAVAALCNGRAAAELIGGTLIIVRQVWALRGQGVVSTLAMALHRQGRCWDRRALADLRARLVQLPAVHAGRRRGLLVQHSGPAWVRTLLANFPATKWRAACIAVGELFGDSAVAEASSSVTGANSAVAAVTGANSAVAEPRSLFYRTCHTLLHEAKLPGVGTFSVVSLVRCGCTCRFAVDKARVEVCEEAWST